MNAIINISGYKTELLLDIYTNDRIVEAIDSQSPGYIPGEPDSLLYRNIFPFLRVPFTQNIADTYVLVSVDVDRVSRGNRAYAKYHTTMWSLAHLDRMEMPRKYGATRIDYIAEELVEVFHGQRKFGFSEFELISNREVLLDTKYLYRELVFTCDDLREPVGLGVTRNERRT